MEYRQQLWFVLKALWYLQILCHTDIQKRLFRLKYDLHARSVDLSVQDRVVNNITTNIT